MNVWTIFWISLALFFFIVAIIVSFLIYQIRVYRYKIRLYRNIGNGWQEYKLYRSRELVIPESLGEKVLWVPKAKVFVSAYGEMMGKNLYYYAQGQDGYWYNIKLGDIDAKMGMLDIEVVNRDVRSFHTTNAKNIRERYKAPKNWPMLIMAFSFVLVIILTFAGGWFLYKQVGEISEANAGSLTVAKEVTIANQKVTENLDETISRLNVLLEKVGVEVKEGQAGIG